MTQQSQETTSGRMEATDRGGEPAARPSGPGPAGEPGGASAGQEAAAQSAFGDPPLDSARGKQSGIEPPSSAALVPVHESIRYRRRAQVAERRVAELQQQLDEQQRARASAEAELAATRRRAELTGLLAGRGVIDLEVAVLLAEQRLAGTPDAPPDPAGAIEQLLKDKPYLLANAELATEERGREGEGASPLRSGGDAGATQALRGGPPRRATAPEGGASGRREQAEAAPQSPHKETAAGRLDQRQGAAATNGGPVATMTTPTQGRRATGGDGSAEQLRTAARQAAGSGRPADLDQYLKLRRRFA